MIIVITGPTAVGKTKMSIELAKKFNAIVINADAMQIYKELDIGTAKITEKEKEEIPHYLFDIKNVLEDYSIYDYQRDLRKIIDNNKNKNIIIVGGSGLYIKAGLFDYRFNKEENNNIDLKKYSNEELYNLVKIKYPNYDVHINNRKRLERLFIKEKEIEVPAKILYDQVYFIGLTTDRETLYERINKRVDIMLKDGLIDEVKKFYEQNIFSKAIMTGIGYKELYKYFSNELSLEESVELIKKNSRHYAKRQYTFFNNQLNMTWFNVDFDNFDNTINEVINYLKGRKNEKI